MKSSDKKRFVDIHEIAEELGCHIRTIQRLVEAGEFPRPLRLGLRKWVWLRQTYDAHIEKVSKDCEHVSGTR